MNDLRNLLIDNLQNIEFDKFDQDFSFIVNGKEYKTNSVVANILSPNISNMFAKNMNLSYYEINTESHCDFNKIIHFGEMKAIDLNDEEKKFFLFVMSELGNNNKLICFLNEFQGDISVENVFQRIEIKKILNVDTSEEAAFISRNFHDFNMKYPDEILKLDVDIMEQIISNSRLYLYDEEELFDIVLKLYLKSKEYSILFSYIVFINLSSESLQKFNANFDINDMNDSIWKKIRCRLDVNVSNGSKENFKNGNFELLENRYFPKRYDNILQHLKQQHFCITPDVIHITSSSVNSGNVERIIDGGDFTTHDEANSWIQVDFKDRKVFLDGYTLKTFYSGENDNNRPTTTTSVWGVQTSSASQGWGFSSSNSNKERRGHLKSWILEVSNDGQNYFEIDRHENCDILNKSGETATFKFSCSSPQRFVRLTQIGPNSKNNNILSIYYIDFSGFLTEYF